MGEEAMSSGEAAMDLELKAEGKTRSSKKEGSPVSVVRWERFLPRMVLRVMLVEADDSTRQIITALLRKCSYRVAAVSDGLKAWELLKGKPHNVDLILTEVELPSISGFALLTLIGEHEICKNIPVIMMSSKDSVSTVYKCMMRGAADFLVKPVRKNELRNLWQHVWRRQVSASGGNGPQDESVAQQKVEATAENNENNAASNHSSEIKACIQRNRECIEKGTDAQSSCTKPDLEAERGCPENVLNLSPSTLSKSPVRDKDVQNHQECDRSNRKPPMSDCEERGCVAAACEDAKAMTQGDDVATEIGKAAHYHITDEGGYNNCAPVNSSREAIDLIGAFDNSPKCGHRNSFSDNGPSKVDSSPLLDLSLRRSNPSGSVNQVSDGRPTLNHSDASAFSRYISRAVQPPGSSATMCNEQKDNGTERQFSHHMPNYSSYPNGFSLSSQQNTFSVETTPESVFPCPQRKVFPVPVKGIRLDGLCNPYGSVAPPIFCAQSGHEQLSRQVNVLHSPNLGTRNSQQLHKIVQVNADTSTNQTELQQRQELESSADRRYFSSATDQSGSSGFCNGTTTTSHLNGIGCGSNGNIDQVPVVRAAAGSGSGEGVPTHDTNCHRSFQREAALNKFRMKRKDRCFDKKVRYESRKKLAEQRPRVKGQFVRHAQNELLLTESDRQ